MHTEHRSSTHRPELGLIEGDGSWRASGAPNDPAHAEPSAGGGADDERSARVAALVRQASTGDSRAWEALVRQFEDLLRRIARAHRLNDADAADVAQATWLKLFEHIARLQDPARVGAWLATTARRECLRLLGDNQRLVPLGEEESELESPEPPAGGRLLRAERDRALWQGVADLGPRDRALLTLLVAGPSPAYGEISARLDMPIGSIGPTRARALGRLRDRLADDGSLMLLAA
jgi:RNA polymerase sigma factor (sigma-70 family)